MTDSAPAKSEQIAFESHRQGGYWDPVQLVGTDGDDTLEGGGGDDTILAGGGNDVLRAHDGSDSLDGGTGNDTLIADLSGNATMNGGDGDDYIYVGDYFASSGHTIIADGGAGNDIFNLVFGVETNAIKLSGGSGTDIYVIGAYTHGNVTIADFAVGPGGDMIDVTALIDADTRPSGAGGNPFGNGLLKLVQQGANALLQKQAYGATGYETIFTLLGVDAQSLTADNFVDGLLPNGGLMHGLNVQGDSGRDSIAGSRYDDTLAGGDGDDNIRGGGGVDVLDGGNGDDTLQGDGGNDTLLGGSGDDYLIADKGSDILRGGSGNDTFITLSNAETHELDGGDGNDTFVIRKDDDFYTMRGTVNIFGGAGDDVVEVGSNGSYARIYATGGAGRDTYRVLTTGGDGVLSVSDFAVGAGGDRIDVAYLIDDSLANFPRLRSNPFAKDGGVLRLVQQGADTLLQYDAGTSPGFITVLKLSNLRSTTLTADNFVNNYRPDGEIIKGVEFHGESSSFVGTHLDDTVMGGAANEYLDGAGGNDYISGGGGNDTLLSGYGADTLLGGDGDDELRNGSQTGMGSSVVTMEGGAGNDKLTVFVNDSSQPYIVRGGDGDDQISITISYGTTAAVIGEVDGGAGNDVIQLANMVGLGNWSVKGGTGSDTFVPADFSLSSVISDFQTGVGGDKIDLMRVLSGQMKYQQAGGNPFAAGVETVKLVQSGADTLVLALDKYSNHDVYSTLLVLKNVKVSALVADNFVNGIDPDGGAVKGQMIVIDASGYVTNGTQFNDTIIGSNLGGGFYGRGGDDVLQAVSTSRDAKLYGEGGNDTLLGSDGNDWLEGGSLSTYGPDNDSLDGGAGNDTLSAYAGNDTLQGGDGDDVLTVYSSESPETAAAYITYMNGGAGNDEIYFRGNTASHTVLASGGAGVDTYRFSYINNPGIHITDFKGGAGGDLMDVSKLEKDVWYYRYPAMDLTSGNSAFWRLVQSGNQVLLQFDQDGAAGAYAFRTIVALDNLRVTDITSANFVPMLVSRDEEGVFTGGAGDDTILGDAGNNELDGGGGADIMNGGAGDDRYYVSEQHDQIIESADGGYDIAYATTNFQLPEHVEELVLTGRATQGSGNAGNDIIRANGTLASQLNGLAGHDQLYGGAGVDTLSGGAGNDTLDGGAGADKLIGGSGNDIYIVDNAGDVITELTDEGVDGVRTSLGSYSLGANLENLTYTGVSAFTGIGNALDNRIIGGNGGNKLDGGAGNDEIRGGGGNDSILGGAGDDTVSAGAGKDTIDGGEGMDTLLLAGSFSSYTIKRVNNTDTVLTDAGGNVATVRGIESISFNGEVRGMTDLWGNAPTALNDSLSGSTGDDTLDGGVGVDTLAGGTGNDTYIIDNVRDVVVELANAGIDLVKVGLTSAGTYFMGDNLENVTVTAAASVAANVTGNALDNLIIGNAAGNTLAGGAGNDTLDGGAGADKLSGGSGDDVYIVDNAGDVVTEAVGEGTDTVRTALATYTLSINVENLTYTGVTAFTGTGNALGNVIIGGNAGNKLDGGAGNDTLSGGGGNDSLQGGLGDDVIAAGTGKDTIDGGAGADALQGLGNFADYTITRPNATDTVLTSAGGNVLTVRNVENFVFADGDKTLAQVQRNIASIGNDDLHGTDGDDVLNGGLGVDTLDGGLGNDTYVILNAADVVVEGVGGGTDLVQVALTAAGTYTLAANVENATVTAAAGIAANITGNALDNILTGNAAANTLLGGAGNDTLIGGAGADKLSGGVGDDTYVVADAGDVITELLGEGTDTVQTTLATYTLAANVDNLTYTGVAAFTGTGNVLGNVITGGNAGNKLDGGAGNDTLAGGAGNDSLQGGLGDDVIAAGVGKDTIDGGAGDDALRGLGNFASYTITRPNATDTVLTSAGGNVLTVRNVEHFIFADGDKTLAQVQRNIASIGNDDLHGTDGDDVLNGGLGLDTLDGGLGNDMYVILNAADVVVEGVGGGTDLVQVALTAAGTYTLAANVENATVTTASIAANITGNALDNILTGNAAANILIGGAGNDTLIGGAGADKLLGGAGDDTYIVADAGDVVTEVAGEGTDIVRTALATFTLAANLENLSYTGATAFTGTGNVLGNVITGGNAGNKLDGGAGNDTLSGGAVNDSLQGGLGDDAIAAGTGKDTIDGGAGADALQGLGNFASYTITRPNATDTVLTSAGGNVLTVRNVEHFIFADGEKALAQVQRNIASIGNDDLHGTDGDDVLNGGLGLDTLDGGLGNDTYVILNAADVVMEDIGGGTDLVQVALTAAGTYTLAANVENATVTAAAGIAANITGNALDNILTGNAAANTLIGGAGNDTLNGGAGADKLIGGIGDDLYIVDNAGDVLTEAQNEGTDSVRTSLAKYTLAANVENMEYTGSAAFSGTGNALNNSINGGAGANILIGGAGNDTLTGHGGNDSLSGGDNDDQFDAGTGKDTIDGGAGSDTLIASRNFADYTITLPNATDTVLDDKQGNIVTIRNTEYVVFADGAKMMGEVQGKLGGAGNDFLRGTANADVLDGGAGNDTLQGLGGADTLIGGAGNDIYIIDGAASMAVVVENGGGGIDQVTTNLPSYRLPDNVENLFGRSQTGPLNFTGTGNALDNVLNATYTSSAKLDGGAGNDTLVGGGGNDSLLGGDGDDRFEASYGKDTVDGGSGFDTLVLGYPLGKASSFKVTQISASEIQLTDAGGYSFTVRGVENFVFSDITATLENLTQNLHGVGTSADVVAYGANIVGTGGTDNLVGSAGNDSIDGAGGSDTLTGGGGADAFVIPVQGMTTITDMVSGSDRIMFHPRDIKNAMFLQSQLVSEPGTNLYGNVVIFTQKLASFSTFAAAKLINSYKGYYDAGEQMICVLSTATDTALYRFTSSGVDNVVAASELTQIAILTGTPSTTAADYHFI